jgi:ketosteroid isomerase-like protein
VLSCYTEDCVYQDPNTRGPIVGHDAFRRYLTRLFEAWNMHWSLREFFPFSDEEGDATYPALLSEWVRRACRGRKPKRREK